MANGYMKFEDAREFMQTQNLMSVKEWWQWSSKRRPSNIPSAPDRVYRDRGWAGWPNFLGYTVRKRSLLNFKEAREYVRSLGFTRMAEWKDWRNSGERPEGIPFSPNLVYAERGWNGWPDFLGYSPMRGRDFVSFKEAREFARALDVETREQWEEWTKAGGCPTHIPRRPNVTYKDKGWSGWDDFLIGGDTAKTSVVSGKGRDQVVPTISSESVSATNF